MSSPAKPTPHLSGPGSGQRQVTEVDETLFAREVVGPDDIPRAFWVWRKRWPKGGYLTHSVCQSCHEHRQAGGQHGEKTIALYQKQRHTCGDIIDVTPVWDVDEPAQPFGV